MAPCPLILEIEREWHFFAIRMELGADLGNAAELVLSFELQLAAFLGAGQGESLGLQHC